MTETQTIIDAYRQAAAEHARAALATVVRVEGSAYRRPGARMLVMENGRTTGVISGGCLEGDIRERADTVIRSGRPVCIKYDATADEDIVWGLGSGCNGIVHVLIEPVSARTDDLVRFLDACSTSERRAAFATVTRSESPELPLGARMLLYPDGATAADSALAAPMVQGILTDLETAVQRGTSFTKQYGRGDIEIFVEVVEPRVRLVVFGAGPDVAPLVAIAHHQGWHATVVDTKARERSLERFADADAVILCGPEEVRARVPLTESTLVVVMTHNYLHDLEVLNAALDGPARYIGCLGPKRRTEQLLSQLRGTPSTALFGVLHAPVGMDLGAESPSEIALSIAAEILAVLRRRSGGPLHRRDGSIHGHSPTTHQRCTAAR
jgi:xanthine dehydrogenase accessory factor